MTNRIVPHEVSFNQVDRISSINNYILISSTILVAATIFFEESIKNSQQLNDGLNAFNSLLIVVYIILEITGSFLLHRAEAKRRLDFIDNSFDTSYSGKKSENYFTNANLSPSLYKMVVNCFENTFFTSNISRRMLFPLFMKNLFIIGIFVMAAALGEKRVVVNLLQMALPILLLQQLVKLSLYVYATELQLTNFKELFNDLKSESHEKRIPEMLKNVIYYESNISWASILLSKNLFNKLNPSLSQEWNQLKDEYKIPMN